MDNIQTPYGRVYKNEATSLDDNGARKIALMLPKNLEGLKSLTDAGLNTEIAEGILKDVTTFIGTVSDMVAADGQAKGFTGKKMFKDGDKYADQRIEDFKDDPENEGKEAPEYYNNTRNFWIVNAKTKFDIEFYGPKKSEGMRDDTWAESEIYDGSWARLLVKPNFYNYQGKKGYNFYIGKFIQKWTDDQPYGGGSSASSADVEDAVEFSNPKATPSDYIN
jgi:hypothetical protein